VGFVVNEVALGHVFSEYFGFLCQFSLNRLIIYHPGLVQKVDVASGLSLTPFQEINNQLAIIRQNDIICYIYLLPTAIWPMPGGSFT
jgi:hypothetical protein